MNFSQGHSGTKVQCESCLFSKGKTPEFTKMGEIHELFVLALSLVWFAGATPERRSFLEASDSETEKSAHPNPDLCLVLGLFPELSCKHSTGMKSWESKVPKEGSPKHRFTVRGNKNNTVLQFLALLVAKSMYSMTSMCKRVKGHAHNILDQLYGITARVFQDAYTLWAYSASFPGRS